MGQLKIQNTTYKIMRSYTKDRKHSGMLDKAKLITPYTLPLPTTW